MPVTPAMSFVPEGKKVSTLWLAIRLQPCFRSGIESAPRTRAWFGDSLSSRASAATGWDRLSWEVRVWNEALLLESHPVWRPVFHKMTSKLYECIKQIAGPGCRCQRRRKSGSSGSMIRGCPTLLAPSCGETGWGASLNHFVAHCPRRLDACLQPPVIPSGIGNVRRLRPLPESGIGSLEQLDCFLGRRPPVEFASSTSTTPSLR